MARTGKGLREAVHNCLRRGFEVPSEDELTSPFTGKPRAMDVRPGVDLGDLRGRRRDPVTPRGERSMHPCPSGNLAFDEGC